LGFRCLVTLMPKHHTPSTKKLRLVQDGHESQRAPMPPGTPDGEPSVGTSSKGNLPLELTSFVGREREIAEVERLLADHRLLVLHGPGGCGKTRLALKVASDVLEDFEDGACWVELASLSDSGLVAQGVARALGVGEVPNQPLIELLEESLRSKATLLVLDNCEHLVESCAALADTLLRSCPNLRVLATSRETLGIVGERAWLVPSLDLPDPKQRLQVEEIRRYEAIRLFAERAEAVASPFELTESNAPAVARLCRTLDGMPLAIELAAARVRVLSVEQISSRLEDSFTLLTAGSRTALPRQRTLKATIDWSHDQLSLKEKVLFRRLAVFAGGFTLEAVEEVCSGEGIASEEVLDLLSDLVDKSLVMVTERSEETRYRLLETVRQYAIERQAQSSEDEALHRIHAEYYLSLAEGAETELKGARQAEWLDRLEGEHENLRAAIQWALEGEETEMALRMTASAAHMWYPRGYLNEGRRRLEAALSRAAGARAARAKALTEAGWFALEQSDFEEARRLLEESLLLYRELGDEYGVAHALECLGVAKTRLRDYGQALQLLEESLALYRALDHKWGIAISLNNLGIVAQKQGEYEKATTYYLESLALMRVVGDSLSIGSVLDGLGQLFMIKGQLERSATLLEESQELLRKLGDKLTLSTTLRDLAETISLQGDDARAADVYRESLTLAMEVGSKATVAGCLEGLANVALTDGQPARAARVWGAAATVRDAIGLRSSPGEHPDHENQLATARSQLDEGAWEAAWSEGRAMTPEEAVEYASEPQPIHQKPPSSKPSYPAGLSARETEVLRLVAEGLTNPRIAQDLFISPRTVERHMNSIYHKTGVSSRVAAARFASEHDLL
jgi:predicted ATPase/DNA-binding CsgD family transcriptional regulator